MISQSDEPFFTVCGADRMRPETLAAISEAAKAVIAAYQADPEQFARPTPNRAQRRGSTVRNIETARRPFGWDKR